MSNNKQKGFSLVESLISLLIMSVVISASIPLITIRHQATSTGGTGTGSTLYPYQAIQQCNSGTTASCAVGYNNGWNQSCSQVLTAWPSATSQSYNLSTNSAGAFTSTPCTMTSIASAAISGCDQGNTVDCAYAYNNNLNQTCGQIAAAYPSGVSSAGTAHYLSTSSAGARTGSTVTCYPSPPDPDCGAANVTTGSQTLRTSLCNNSVPGSETTPNGTSLSGANQCWVAAPTSGSNCNGTGCNSSRILCNQGGAQDACNALNPNGVVGTTTNSLWRLPTNAELQNWRTTPASNSALITNVRASLDLCDASSSYSPYCNGYSGCSGSSGNYCDPDFLWAAGPDISYDLNGGNWSGPYGNGVSTYAFSVRCVRNT